VAFWARATEQFWRNAMRLWQIPAELAYAEDPKLGVMRTTVYFPPRRPDDAKDPSIWAQNVPIHLTCIVQDAATGAPMTAGVNLVPCDYPSEGERKAIAIELAPGTPAGVYRVVLKDRDSGVEGIYILPFGVPEQSP